MKAQRGAEVQLYSFFNLSTRWGWVVNATPWAALPLGESASIHFIGGWVGPRASLDGCRKSHTHSESIAGRSSP
jgi:hypothetical protein